MTSSPPRMLRRLAPLAASAVAAAACLGVPAAQAASSATAGTPYVAVKHVAVLKASVRKSAGTSFVLKGLPPQGVTAVVLSVSVTRPQATGSLIGYGYGAKRPHVVSLAFSKGHTASALVVVVPGSKQRGTLFNASAASEHVVATVVGYYAVPGATRAATALVPVTPERLASVLLKAKGSGAFVAVGRAKVAVAGTAGVLVAVTTATSGAAGSVRLSPYGSKSVTSLTFAAGRTRTTLLVLTPGSKGRVRLTSTSGAAVRVRVDVLGYLTTLYVPAAPTAVTATAGANAVVVGWKAPASDGGAPISSYTVTASPGGVTASAGGTATSVLVPGLSAGTSYTFTVTATNSRGVGPASAATSAVSPYTTPGAPGGFGFTAGYGQVTILIQGTESDGGSPVTSYRITAAPGGAVVTVAAKTVPASGALTIGDFTTATFNGLTPGVFYTFTAVAINAAGDSPASPATPAIQAGGVGRASVSSNGSQGDSGSLDNDMTPDGRYVAFDSAADNLVAGDTGGHEDVFLRDRLLGTTTLVSAANGGGFGDGDSEQPSVSSDGRYVAFTSAATNLTGVVIGGHLEVYVRDVQQGTTKLISAGAGGVADADSGAPAISADGTTIVFESKADNLVTPLNNGLYQQIYAADRQSDDLTAVSVGVGAVQANGDSSQPTISGDGKIVAWASKAHNLETALATTHQNIYQRTLSSSTTSLLSSDDLVIEGNADSADPAISEDGSYTAFDSLASNLTVMPDLNGAADVFRCFKGCNTPVAVDVGPFGATANHGALLPSLSKDGALVAYVSASTDLAPGVVPSASSPQIFVSAWSSNVTHVATRAADGSLGNAASTLPHLSSDGSHVSFASFATNLGPGDTNSRIDVFAADLPSELAGGLPSY